MPASIAGIPFEYVPVSSLEPISENASGTDAITGTGSV
jgi:hypothetical protein